MTTRTGVYRAALRRAAAGHQPTLDVVRGDGVLVSRWRPAGWTGGLRLGDHRLLAQCVGPTLDIGCGPGRFAAALARTGRPALGVDISAEAVRQARRRGASAIRRSVFAPLPGEGTWRHVLLADDNIGIGGHPVRLLRRCGGLLADRGDILVELSPPGSSSWAARVMLDDGERRSAAFAWAGVTVDDIAALADRAALRLVAKWTEGGRWFAHLTAA